MILILFKYAAFKFPALKFCFHRQCDVGIEFTLTFLCFIGMNSANHIIFSDNIHDFLDLFRLTNLFLVFSFFFMLQSTQSNCTNEIHNVIFCRNVASTREIIRFHNHNDVCAMRIAKKRKWLPSYATQLQNIILFSLASFPVFQKYTGVHIWKYKYVCYFCTYVRYVYLYLLLSNLKYRAKVRSISSKVLSRIVHVRRCSLY